MSEEQTTDFVPKSLDSVFNGEPEQPKAEPAPETPAEPAPAADEAKADPEPKGEAEKPKEDAPPASEAKSDHVPIAALKDERRKRQELETRLNAIEQQQTKPKRPDPYENPDEAAEFDRNEQREREFQTRCSMSQEMMREIHEDYDDVEAVFMEKAASNPALGAQLARHPFPAKFAYSEGKRLKTLEAMGDDPSAYVEAKMAEAAKAGAAAALAEIQNSKNEALKASLPESLAEAPSASSKDVAKWEGPKPLSQILG